MVGGDGQIVEFGVRTGKPWNLIFSATGVAQSPQGLEGGEPGRPGSLSVNGKPWAGSGRSRMAPDDLVRMETPGAGGFGAAPDSETKEGGSQDERAGAEMERSAN